MTADYYDILQVSPDADVRVIRAAYRALTKKFHPDAGRPEASNAKMRSVNEAYAVLSDPQRRREYDVRRKQALEKQARTQTHPDATSWTAGEAAAQARRADEERRRRETEERLRQEAEQRRREEIAAPARKEARRRAQKKLLRWAAAVSVLAVLSLGALWLITTSARPPGTTEASVPTRTPLLAQTQRLAVEPTVVVPSMETPTEGPTTAATPAQTLEPAVASTATDRPPATPAGLPANVVSSARGAAAEIGPATVWEVTNASISAECLASNPRTACMVSVMQRTGASPEALSFVNDYMEQFGDQACIASFGEMGKVDLAGIVYPFHSSENRQPVLVNGTPRLVFPSDGAVDGQIEQAAGFASLKEKYPNALPWVAGAAFETMEKAPQGGQRFIFQYRILDGCHACPVIGQARAAVDFDQAGTWLGTSVLSVMEAAGGAGDQSRR